MEGGRGEGEEVEGGGRGEVVGSSEVIRMVRV